MGTNYYYFRKPKCECCGREFEPLHIGKSSVGWCFLLHVEPELGINTLDDWKSWFKVKGSYIRNECNEIRSEPEMIQIITERFVGIPITRNPKWLEQNHAEPGPNNLLRSQVGRGCVGHGDGTWDYITGEFS
jgi:hypothetical protein